MFFDYKAEPTVMATKIPSYFMTGYEAITEWSAVLLLEKQYVQILDDYAFLMASEGAQERLDYVRDLYNYTNGFPKSYLHIKLDPNISWTAKNVVVEGLSNLLTSDL